MQPLHGHRTQSEKPLKPNDSFIWANSCGEPINWRHLRLEPSEEEEEAVAHLWAKSVERRGLSAWLSFRTRRPGGVLFVSNESAPPLSKCTSSKQISSAICCFARSMSQKPWRIALT